MTINKYQPHVLVLPEDDANRQLANGFELHLSTRQFRVLPPAGGWTRVRDAFERNHVAEMDRRPERFMVLLLDFDTDTHRCDRVRRAVPDRLHRRVFVLGVWTEPEDLRREFGIPWETIGYRMAEDCRLGTEGIWRHRLLTHNTPELDRLRLQVHPVLFPIPP